MGRIRLIVTRSGYVESNQIATIVWRYQSTEKLKPEEALRSLANELAIEYRREVLFDFDTHIGHTSEANAWDLTQKSCIKCGKLVRTPFAPEDFETWVRSITSAVASGGIGDFSIGELSSWWPWNSFADVHNYKPSQILLVEERFESIATVCIKPDDTFTDVERDMWAGYLEEEAYPFKVEQGPDDKFWRAEIDYQGNIDDSSTASSA